MNRVFTTVWSYKHNAWVVASEHTSRHGKRGGSGRRLIGGVGFLGLTFLSASFALAADLPTGGQIVHGNGQISTPGSNQMVIDQTSNKLAIDWNSFNISSGNKVTFDQPGSQSIALNRVLGSDGSKIMGTLEANGRVFLINPNGILFGAGASVDVGGLVASTLDLSVDDFKRDRYRFKGDGSNSSVDNHGVITAAEGGAIALLGGTVSNNGTLVANQGSVALAAGNTVTLDFAGDGLLNVQIDEAVMDALVENHQLIQADGGQVLLTANAGEALLKTVVNNTGVIEAHTLGEKDGKIVLLGGFDGGTTLVAGTLDASAPLGGGGGFIETSGAHVKIADGAKVTTKANTGQSGTWLIDPNDFTVAASGGDMTGTAVSQALSDNGSFIIETASMGAAGGNGDIHINDGIAWNTSSALTLKSERDININANINSTGAGKLALEYGQGAVAEGNGADYHLNQGAKVSLSAGDNFNTKLGSDGNTRQYTVITELGDQGSTTAQDLQGINGNLNGYYVLGGDIDASITGSWNDGLGFTPIGNLQNKFSGEFDGLGHQIAGLVINRPDEDTVGLFGAIYQDTTVRNLGLLGGSTTGNQYVGGLVGFSWGIISNAYAAGLVFGVNDVGGLAGVSSIGTISDSYATGEVTGVYNVGGLAGSAGKIINAYATGRVTGSGNFVGGLVGGLYSGSISSSYATGPVIGASSNVGGLAGYSSGGAINNSHATGAVTGEYMVGGLIGHSYGDINNSYATGAVVGGDDVGGLVGRYNSRTLSNVYATGAVKGQSVVGGLVGRSNYTSIISAYATGAVGGISYVGGLVGYGNDSTISNSYAIGTVTGQYAIGGLAGANWGQISNSFYAITDRAGAGVNNSGVPIDIFGGNHLGTAVTFANLTSLSTFANSGWDIDGVGGTSSVWRIYEGNSTPLLRSFLKAVTLTLDSPSATSSKAYDGNIASDSFNYVTDQPGVILDGVASYTSASANVGSYSVRDGTLRYGFFSDQQGYDIKVVGDPSLAITPKALTLSGLTANDKVYDGNNVATLSGGSLNGLVGDETLSLSGLVGTFADKQAGINKVVTVTGGLGNGSGLVSNYSFTNPTGLTASIDRANLTVTANNANKTYDGQAWSGGNGLSYDGFVSGEDASVLGGAALYGGNAQGARDVGFYTISVDGLMADNYTIRYQDGMLEITRRPISVTPSYGDVLASLQAEGFSGQHIDLYLGIAASGEHDRLIENGSVIDSGIRLPEGL